MKAGGRALDGVLPVAAVAAVLAFYSPQGGMPPRLPIAEVGPPSTPSATPSSAPQGETFEAVRPVLQTLAEAMGRSSRDPAHRLAVTLEEELASDRHAAALPPAADDPDAQLHRRRRDAADAARRDANLRLIADLATHEPVQFVTALVPDYVDSQSGWVADHVLAGVQAGFADAGYSLDRFHLPDWSPTGSSPGTRVPRVAHEQQPGALVFRRAAGAGARPRLCVVLVVLETPTAGPHPGALGNAIALQREWARVTRRPGQAPAPTDIRIVGPTFSGSFDPLLAVLQAEHDRQALRVHVANGSANGTGSFRKMERDFIASYRQYVSDFEQLWHDVEDFLVRRGYARCDIALLVEATPFGQSTASRRGGEVPRCDVDTVFRFPLHVSQLRTSSSNEPIVLRSMLAPPSVPVDIREATPATDLVPALKPGMVSPTVEVNFRTLLQAIRLEGFRAVGVVATDARDALFLARELRRATPSVQLVLFGAQAIYLHSEYAPFMRGALVASTWPLAPMVEPLPGGPRIVLPSQEAHGVLRAVQHVLAPDEPRDAPAMEAPYVGRERSERSERAYEVWLSVVGSDAFWPLRVSPAPRGEAASLRAATWAWLVLLLCAAFVSTFFVEAVRALRGADGHRERGMLAPAAAGRWSTFAHAVNVAQAGALVAVVAFGATFVFISKVFGVRTFGVTGAAAAVGLAILALSLWVAAHAIWQVRHGAVAALQDHVIRLRQRCGRYGLPPVNDLRIVAALSVAALLALASLAATWALMLWFMREVATLDHSVRAVAFTRLLAGGVVSPVPIVMCLVFGLLVPVVWDRNRGTLLGPGYVALYERSETFRYLLGEAGPADANLHSLVSSLDMPLPSLRTRRLAVAVCIALALLIVFARHGTSLDGLAFSRFLLLATFTVLLRVALLLLQATQAWRRLRAALGRMAHEPFVPALRAVRSRHVAWNVSLFAARVGDLRPVLRLVQRLGQDNAPDGAVHAIASAYTEEVASRPKLPLAISRTWAASWSLVDAVVPALRTGIWSPRGAAASAAVAGPPATRPRVDDVELLVALHVAFILRDMVSRVVSTMTNALVSLGLLTLGHLMYMFQGRSVFLVVDMLFLLVAAGVALWLLVSVERDFVLSILRDTRPGRVEFNAGFIKGVAAYVVLPLVAALGAVFPEIGIHFTSVLDPLRRIVGQ